MAVHESPLIGFRRHLRAETVPGEAVYLTSARGTVAVSGAPVQVLAPLLDGSHSLAEVQGAVAPTLSAELLGQVLGKLAEADLIGSHRPSREGGGDRAAEAYWDLAGLGAERAAAGLAGGSVGAVTLGEVEEDAVLVACREAGLTIGVAPEDAALLMVLCDDYLDPGLAEINAAQLASRRPWLLAKPCGPDVWTGPVFQPGSGPCWECVATRLRAHRPGEACLRRAMRISDPIRPPETSLPATRAMGVQLAVLEVAKWLAGDRHERQEGVWSLDTLTLESRHHRVARRPQCPACGDPEMIADRVRRPVHIRSRAKRTVDGNGHRAMSLEQVWDGFGDLVDPITGITDKIVRDPRNPSFLHSYVSGPNRAMGVDRLSAVRAGLRQQSGGKGVTDQVAKVGALCEAVERYSASRFGDEPTVLDSFRGLGAQAVHPDECQLFHPRQYRDRARWNAANMPFQHVPEPFDERAVIEWTPVWSLTSWRSRLLPTDLLYYNGRGGVCSLRANSNGNAAGSTLEDAILQGFFELVERDAVALWWYNRTRHPGVDLESFDDPWLADLPGKYRLLNRQVWVLDITSDFGIPVMVALSRRMDKNAEDIMLGFGAHFDPHIAVRRALTELGQLLPAVVNAAADGTGYESSDPHLRSWWRTASVINQPYLLPDPDQDPRIAGDYQRVFHPDFKDDIRYICGLVRRKGLDLLVLDQTRPDIGMPVAKVVVPGLRHVWARYAPGRLYDIPLRLGRVETPTAYEGLNPIPLFM